MENASQSQALRQREIEPVKIQWKVNEAFREGECVGEVDALTMGCGRREMGPWSRSA